jgi:hypothetical protein
MMWDNPADTKKGSHSARQDEFLTSAQHKRPGIGLRVTHDFCISSEEGDDIAQVPFLVGPGLARKHWKDLPMCRCIDFGVQFLGV